MKYLTALLFFVNSVFACELTSEQEKYMQQFTPELQAELKAKLCSIQSTLEYVQQEQDKRPITYKTYVCYSINNGRIFNFDAKAVGISGHVIYAGYLFGAKFNNNQDSFASVFSESSTLLKVYVSESNHFKIKPYPFYPTTENVHSGKCEVQELAVEHWKLYKAVKEVSEP